MDREKKWTHLKDGVGGELCGYLGSQKEPVKPETSLEAKMTKLKLSYFGHVTRRQSSWKR